MSSVAANEIPVTKVTKIASHTRIVRLVQIRELAKLTEDWEAWEENTPIIGNFNELRTSSIDANAG